MFQNPLFITNTTTNQNTNINLLPSQQSLPNTHNSFILDKLNNDHQNDNHFSFNYSSPIEQQDFCVVCKDKAIGKHYGKLNILLNKNK